MEKVFLDTNILMDFLLNRSPFSYDAKKIIGLSETGKNQGYISALTIATAYYLLKRISPHIEVCNKLSALSKILTIVDLKKDYILTSFDSNFKDFEDSLQNECAKSISGLKIIITRNPEDFKTSHLEIMTPDKYLKKWITG